MYSKLLLLLAAFFAATFWFGCEDEEPYRPPRPYLDGIVVFTGQQNDTLYFVPNDSASTTVTIVVTDSYGNARPGQKVDISLSDPSLGVLEFTDLELMDTTNALGRVNAIFRSYGIEGQIVITASTGGLTVSDTLTIREFDFATFSADFELYPDTVNVNQWVQPILQMHVVSDGRIPVPNLTIPIGISFPFGQIEPFVNIGPTDQNGFAEMPMPLGMESTPGWTYCVYISAFAAYDTVCVTLIDQ